MHKTMHGLLYAGIAVVLLASAYLLGASTGLPANGLVPVADRYQEGYDAGLKAARASSGTALPPPVAQSVEGTIAQTTADGFTLTVGGATRTVTLGASTTISEMTQKDPAAFQKEMAAFAKRTPKPGDVPPSAVTTKTLTLADLAVGDQVTVLVAPGTDLGSIVEPLSVIRTAAPVAP